MQTDWRIFHDTIPDAAANMTDFDVGSSTGAQGIITMYDEWTQYNHNMPMMYLLHAYDSTRSDFYVEYALNFAWAAPRYFWWAKDNHPDDFQAMMASEVVREATLTLWGQTMLYYDAYSRDTDWTPSTDEERYLEAMLEVDSVSIESRYAETYNFTVEGYETYFVVSGDVEVLVHNQSPDMPPQAARYTYPQ